MTWQTVSEDLNRGPILLHLLCKGKSREIKQIDGFVGNSNFKSTYLGEFFMDFRNFYIFEEEIIPSRGFFLRNRVCWPWRESL